MSVVHGDPIETNQAEGERSPRFVVGMDLGTTNSAVSYVDITESPWQIRTLRIPQLVAAGTVEALETLPSFHYEPAAGEFDAKLLRLPFGGTPPGYVVGVFARDHGASIPSRLIASAKSWLCHPGVDRTAPLLPWHGAPDVTRLSPVEVSARYIRHVVEAWEAQFPGYPLDEQDFVLTIPASFDEVARQLTIKAANLAGLRHVTLIEEPQAAFYAWIYHHAQDWPNYVQAGQKILVCDIGGGTTDFTLIDVRQKADGTLGFHRVAVGEHLVLGGDNLDLALAHHVEKKLGEEQSLDPQTWLTLVRKCQSTKEQLLGTKAPQSVTLTLPGKGSRLLAGARQIELSREEIQQLLLEGFFPFVEIEAKPASRRSGFQEFGLPYAPDPAVTRYLAAFLTAHRDLAEAEQSGERDPARPDLVLFNGGVFYSPAIRQRLIEVLSRWFSPPSQDWEPIVLRNDRLDLAVSQGAAYYGMVRRGEGVRISATLARSYYLGVDIPPEELPHLLAAQTSPKKFFWNTDELPATTRGAESKETAATAMVQDDTRAVGICVLPAGTEPGQEITLSGRSFRVRVGEPVEFPVYYSGTRLTDKPGDLLPIKQEEMTPLPPIRTVLKASRKQTLEEMEVRLHARLTEIGTLELWYSQVDGRGTWRLEFDVRSAVQSHIAPHVGAGEQQGVLDEQAATRCLECIDRVFGPQGTDSPDGLLKRMANALGMPRHEWPPTLLRRIWQRLYERESGRHRSASHEARWLNVTGFALRPGYGVAADDWRVAETWRILHGRLHYSTPACRAEWWVLWRRLAGGLTAGQQQALANPLLASLRTLHRQQMTGSGSSDFPNTGHEGIEIFRMLGAFELLLPHWKVELGNIILDLLPKRKLQRLHDAMLWALSRIGARVPAYGPLNSAVPAETAAQWTERLLRLGIDNHLVPFVVMQLTRRTGDRYRDVSQKVRDRVLRWLKEHEAAPHLITLVKDVAELDRDEQTEVFGETLPKGLRIA